MVYFDSKLTTVMNCSHISVTTQCRTYFKLIPQNIEILGGTVSPSLHMSGLRLLPISDSDTHKLSTGCPTIP